jgi:recombination protein U
VRDVQLKLEGVPAPEPHANRGMLFEGMLVRTHDYYERQGIARVEKIPNAWAYCGEGEWRKLPDSLRGRAGDGRPLKRRKTSCDFIGTALGRGVAIDAKEFGRTSIPLANFEPHQVRRLAAFARVKSLAGFLIYSKLADAVFWVEAGDFNVVYHMGQVKSLNLDWLRKKAVLICEKPGNDIVDWARALIGTNPPAAGMKLCA